MKLDDFESEELIQLIDNFNHYSILIKSNILFNELKIEDIQSELIKRGIEKKENTYFVKLEQITLLEQSNVAQKVISNEQILGTNQENNLPKNKQSKQQKTKTEKSPIKLNFDQKHFSLYQIEGNSLIDLKINNGDLILIRNTPTKIRSKLRKLKLQFISDINNSNFIKEWISILEAFNSKLIVFKLNDKIFVKELNIVGTSVYLMSKNNKYFNYNLSPKTNFEILGIVTNVIRNLD